MLRVERPSTVFTAEFEIDHLGETPLLTRFQPSQSSTYLRMHETTAFILAQPSVENPLAGWTPGQKMMEPIIH